MVRGEVAVSQLTCHSHQLSHLDVLVPSWPCRSQLHPALVLFLEPKLLLLRQPGEVGWPRLPWFAARCVVYGGAGRRWCGTLQLGRKRARRASARKSCEHDGSSLYLLILWIGNIAGRDVGIIDRSNACETTRNGLEICDKPSNNPRMEQAALTYRKAAACYAKVVLWLKHD